MNMDKLYCIGYIDDELIEKADKYISKKKKCTFKKWTALAASFITIFLIFAALISFKNKNTITAYAYVTNEKITSTAAVIKTGTISDSGEMKGHQLIFYILGENIEKIREYLSKNNISKTSDIAEYIGLSLPRTRAILKEIPDVSPIGNNSNRKWTLQK